MWFMNFGANGDTTHDFGYPNRLHHNISRDDALAFGISSYPLLPSHILMSSFHLIVRLCPVDWTVGLGQVLHL